MSRRGSETRSKPKQAKRSVEDPSPDVYVGLLFLSVGALITGCVFLAIELASYGWKISG